MASLRLFLLAAGGVSAINAQDSDIESHVVSGGGGTSSAGDITVRGTFGQPAAGIVSGGDTILHGGFWDGGLSVVVEPDESFDSWMESLPEQDKPPEGQRGPDDAPAGDGMSNLLKYALGLMPMKPSPDAAPAVVINGGGYLGIELKRSRDAAVTFQVEGSSDFEEWVDVPYNQQVIDANFADDREHITLLSGLETGQHPRYFLRLRVLMQ